MVEITKTFGKTHERQTLRSLLETIAIELAPQYEGELRVKRHEHDSDMGFGFDPSYFYVEQKIPGKGFLHLFPKKIMIFASPDRDLSGDNGQKELIIDLFHVDDRAESVIKKYFEQYSQEHGIKKVEMRRGY